MSLNGGGRVCLCLDLLRCSCILQESGIRGFDQHCQSVATPLRPQELGTGALSTDPG